ncbi:MAG: ATP-binding protein [Elusimicrobiota bacterium]
MKILRIYNDLNKNLHPNKVLIIYGPRQVGKTTLLKDFLSVSGIKYKLDSGDNIKSQHILGSQDFTVLKEYAEGYELIAIDEAQKISGIGQALKILVDQVPGIKLIATGSSSFELAGQVGEPLTGRKLTLHLYPISQLELSLRYNPAEIKERLPEWLVYGGYPEVVTTSNKQEKARILEEIVQSYLLKDILELERIKSSKIILDVLRLIAFQIGKEVSLTEIGQQIGIDYKTVARYLDLFEKSFIIYSLRGFSRNLRKEISKKCKYFFYDNGVRNAIVSNFNALELRNDIGELWENFIFMERLKKRSYKKIFANCYFWRTWDQKEVDLVEEMEGKLYGYEIKWSKDKIKPPEDWINTYENASFEVINKENYLGFVA